MCTYRILFRRTCLGSRSRRRTGSWTGCTGSQRDTGTHPPDTARSGPTSLQIYEDWSNFKKHILVL